MVYKNFMTRQITLYIQEPSKEKITKIKRESMERQREETLLENNQR